MSVVSGGWRETDSESQRMNVPCSQSNPSASFNSLSTLYPNIMQERVGVKDGMLWIDEANLIRRYYTIQLNTIEDNKIHYNRMLVHLPFWNHSGLSGSITPLICGLKREFSSPFKSTPLSP